MIESWSTILKSSYASDEYRLIRIPKKYVFKLWMKLFIFTKNESEKLMRLLNLHFFFLKDTFSHQLYVSHYLCISV